MMRSSCCRFVFVVAGLLAPVPALAVLSAEQAVCVNTVGKYSRALSKVQSKTNATCLKAVGKGQLVGTVDSCLDSDPSGKLAAAKEMLLLEEGAACGFPLPPFGYQTATALGSRLPMHQRDAMIDLFGPALDAALLDCSADAAGCACQSRAAKAFDKLLAAERSVYRACKKTKIPTATGALDFVACLASAMEPLSVESDTKGKVAKAEAKLQDTLSESCFGASVPVATAFPGDCSASADAAALAGCLSRQSRCRVCGEVLNAEDTTVDCDAFDDGADNGSCRNFRFRTQQVVDTSPVTCSSVTNTATYTQCDDLRVSGLAMPNGVTCTEDWFSGPLVQTDVEAFCASLTGSPISEKFLACETTQVRWGWLDYLWTQAPINDNGYMKHLRCYY